MLCGGEAETQSQIQLSSCGVVICFFFLFSFLSGCVIFFSTLWLFIDHLPWEAVNSPSLIAPPSFVSNQLRATAFKQASRTGTALQFTL